MSEKSKEQVQTENSQSGGADQQVDSNITEQQGSDIAVDESSSDDVQQANEEAHTQLEADYESLKSENYSLKKEIALLKNSVKPDYTEDVLSLAENLVSDSCDISQAVEKVLEKHPNFRNVILNLGGSTGGLSSSGEDDGFTAGLKNKFLGGF